MRMMIFLLVCICALGAYPAETRAQVNLVPNGSLESADSSGVLPVSWRKGGYGSNTRSLTYPVPGVGGGKAVKTAITSYVSGDAKWFFNPISLSPGLYTYSDDYMSDRASIVTVQFERTDGTFAYIDIATLQPSATFQSISVDFSVPANTANVTIFHLIKGVGFVTVDNVAVRFKESPSGIFSTGAVTLRFDDGWLSQYENALPKLNSTGLKGTFYIVTRQMAEQGFPGYINQTQLRNIYTAGNEIAAHTRTHRDLTTLSSSVQQSEIQGSRQDLIGWNVGSILSFAVPFGSYNQSLITMIQNAGFTSMVTANGGLNLETADAFQLARVSADTRNSLAQLKQAVDSAAANKQWLIITFHEINTSGRTYSITPANFNAIIDYIVQKGIPVVTVSEGVQFLR